MMRAPDIVVLGAGGQVGRAVLEAAGLAGLMAVGHDRAAVDVTDAGAVGAALSAAPGSLVVNAAAFTDVDAAEDRPEAADAVNRIGAGTVARACAAARCRLVHLSTDYVFSGEADRPWRPEDEPDPPNLYGRTKLAGERAVRAAHPDAVVLRTSGVYSPWGRNFVRTMLRAGRERDRLRVVDDQVLGPTSALDLGRALVRLAGGPRFPRGGVLHFCGTPETSWFAFARAVFERSAGDRRPVVEPIASTDWPARARRPAYSMLDVTDWVEATGIAPTDRPAALDEVLARPETGA